MDRRRLAGLGRRGAGGPYLRPDLNRLCLWVPDLALRANPGMGVAARVQGGRAIVRGLEVAVVVVAATRRPDFSPRLTQLDKTWRNLGGIVIVGNTTGDRARRGRRLWFCTMPGAS